MRLLVAEKLYSLCSTTEYRDMPINEINKCINKINKLILYLFYTNLMHFYLF